MKQGIIVLSVVLALVLQSTILGVPVEGLRFGNGTPASKADATWVGEVPGNATHLLQLVKDVNGDGYDDFLMVDPTITMPGYITGKVYLFFGGPNLTAKDVKLTSANASWVGEKYCGGGYLRAASAGDVNGDGLGDLLIADTNCWDFTGINYTGIVYLVLGKRTGWTNDEPLNSSTTQMYVHTDNYRLGQEMAGVGDVNGDGYDDFLVGSPVGSEAGSGSGAMFLVLGRASGWKKWMYLRTEANASFVGSKPYEGIGYSVARAGDVNGDGLSDFVLGAPFNTEGGTDCGKVYVFFGKASGWKLKTSVAEADASFLGENANDQAGYDVAGGGDVNGDGLDDIAIVSGHNSYGALKGGQVYLVFGKHEGWTQNVNLSASNASFVGTIDYQGYFKVRIDGDLDGDGIDDIVLGDAYDASFKGAIWYYLGSKAGLSMHAQIKNATKALVGEVAGDQFGAEISLGDVNQDGIDDLATSAPRYQSDTGKIYLFYPELNVGPAAISSLKACSDEGCTSAVTEPYVNSSVFIELKGTDPNSSRVDTALVRVQSSVSQRGLTLRLIETGATTGIFHGRLGIQYWTDVYSNAIAAVRGSYVNISCLSDPAVNISLHVTVPKVLIWPLHDERTAVEDQPYSQNYRSDGLDPITKWMFSTDAKWLNWSGANLTLYGRPDNSDVGASWADLKAQDGLGNFDEHNFTVLVGNAWPNITTSALADAVQDVPYNFDCSADDEGQGHTTWTMVTNASWLSLDPSTGLLKGTPDWTQVGVYYVDLNFSDGNGGYDSTNLSLTVENVNDPPLIGTTDVLTVLEDVQYSVNYSAKDRDATDLLKWSMATNASWLRFNATGPRLYGRPQNEDVGSYWVNVTVTDGSMASDFHNFTLTVVNVNDPPTITSQPPTTASVLSLYRYDMHATDIDKGDVLRYDIVDGPDNMAMNSSSGEVLWAPTRDQRGVNSVVLGVTDSALTVLQYLNITVEVPKPTLLRPQDKSAIKTTVPEFAWSMDLATTLNVTYDLYLGEGTGAPILLAANLNSTNWTPAAPLRDKTSYVWYVIPKAQGPGGTILGDNSDLFGFSIDTGFIADYSYVLDLDRSSVDAKRGQSVVLMLTITNKGNMDAKVSISITGDLSGLDLKYPKTANLTVNGVVKLNVTISVQKNTPYGVRSLKITTVFGPDTNEKTLQLRIVQPTAQPGIFSSQYLWVWGLLIGAVVMAVLGIVVLAVRRRKVERELATVRAQADQVEDFNIDELFLIYKDGRLVSHVGSTSQSVDEELFSSMLVAIQGFVKDSFQTDDSLSRFDYGSKKMILEKGEHLILAVALSGTEPGVLKENLRTMISKLEGLYAGVIEDWDGDTASFKDIKLSLSSLLDLKKGMSIKKEKEEVAVKSGIEFFGGYVRLKVAIANGLSSKITEVGLKLAYDHRTLQISHIEPEYPRNKDLIALDPVEPSEKRTVAVYFDPLICQESHIDAVVDFKDSHGNDGHADMKRRPVDVVCPLFHTKDNINVAMLRKLYAEMAYKDNRLHILPKDLTPANGFGLVKQVVQRHDMKLVRELSVPKPYVSEAWYYGKAKEGEETLILKFAVHEETSDIEILVASSNLAALTGLLAEVSKNLRDTLSALGLKLETRTDQASKEKALGRKDLLDGLGTESTDAK